jgi:hypothetical protein
VATSAFFGKGNFAEELGFEIIEKDTPWGKTPVKVDPVRHGEPGFFIALLKKVQ